MAIEKWWKAISAQSFITDGTTGGDIQVNSLECFKVKQKVVLSAVGEPDLVLEIKRICSPTKIKVGPKGGNIKAITDITKYTVAKLSSIRAEEQGRPPIDPEDTRRATYEEEPTVAWRTIMVDKLGDFYNTKNPLPVQLSDGSINIGTVNAELEVQLSHIPDSPDPGDVPDSVQIGDGVEIVQVNPDGSINVVVTDSSSASIPIIYTESDVLSVLSEDTVATYSVVNDDSKIQKIFGQAFTYGTWSMYKNSVSAGNLLNRFQTSPTIRNAVLKMDQQDIVNTGDSIVVTFCPGVCQERFDAIDKKTFVRMEGFYL